MSSGPLSTSGWHTPVPGPSGETLWQTDWNRDSPARQTVNNRWSPSSSPGTSGLNGRAGLERTVTISSSNSSVSPQTTLVDIEPTTNYQASNASSDSIGRSNRKRSSKETVGEKTQVETENKHQYHHYHRNSHKHKHKRKESKRSSEKWDRGKLCGDTNHVDNGLGPSSSTNLSIVSSEFCSSPQEFIVISRDTSTSPVSSIVRPGPSCNDATQFQRRKEGSGSRSKSGLRLLSKGREFFKKTNLREVTLLMLKRAQGIVHFRLKSVRLKNIVDGDQTLGKDGWEMTVNVYLRQEYLVSTVKKR